jgi:crossover junction endodeoxyribonuclease RuvC
MDMNSENTHKILGIDPGYATVGYGIIEYTGAKFATLGYGAIFTSPNLPFEQRLTEIYDDICHLIETYHPEFMAIEKLFFTTNQKTGIDVAQARGVITLAGVRNGLQIGEYTPLQVKQAVTGYGKATKTQVQEMVKRILNLAAVPKPDDTADALAVAICHAHTYASRRNLR